MNNFNFKNNVLNVEDVSVIRIAEIIGTPAYIYSKKSFENNFSNFSNTLKKVLGPKSDILVAYSVKSNSNIAVIDILNSLHSGADVVSIGELQRALKVGIPPDKIVFSGVGKTQEEMAFGIDKNILQFNVESLAELKKLSEISISKGKNCPVAIRINPDIEAGGHKNISTGVHGTKFGIDYKEVQKIYEYASNLKGIKIVGIDVHIGSQITNLAPFKLAYNKIADLVRVLREKGHKISNIDLGGGIGILYDNSDNIFSLTEYAEMVLQTVGNLGCKIIFEPGRFISGNAGLLLTKVVRLKSNSKHNFLIVDAAMNDFLRPVLYDASHNIIEVIKKNKKINNLSYKVVGPICETGDIINENCYFNDPKEEDLLAILDVGAYGASMSSTYNSRSLVPEVLVSGKEINIIRKRITADQMMAFESLAKK